MDLRIAARVGVPGIVILALVGSAVVVGHAVPSRLETFAKVPRFVGLCDKNDLAELAERGRFIEACTSGRFPSRAALVTERSGNHHVVALYAADFEVLAQPAIAKDDAISSCGYALENLDVVDLDGDGMDEIVETYFVTPVRKYMRVLAVRDGHFVSTRDHEIEDSSVRPLNYRSAPDLGDVYVARQIYAHDMLRPIN